MPRQFHTLYHGVYFDGRGLQAAQWPAAGGKCTLQPLLMRGPRAAAPCQASTCQFLTGHERDEWEMGDRQIVEAFWTLLGRVLQAPAWLCQLGPVSGGNSLEDCALFCLQPSLRLAECKLAARAKAAHACCSR